MVEDRIVIQDKGVRAEALNPKRSYIVQAPAGSGKTELLIQRYLGLLATVEKPEEILALTFTRKAASEMRERVLKSLSDPNIASIVLDPSLSEHTRKTLELAFEAQQQNKKFAWGLLENPNRMQIMTIDSFCARLVQAMPVGSRFGGMPILEENAGVLYRRAIRNYFDRFLQTDVADESLELVLLELNNNFSQVEGLLVSMLSKRDQWLPYVANTGYLQRDELFGALEAAAYQETAPLVQVLSSEMEDELIALAAYAAENLRVSLKDSPLNACLGVEEMPEVGMLDIARWKGFRELLFTKTGSLRKSVTVAQGFPASSSADDKELSGRYKEFKQRMIEFLAKVIDYPEFLLRLNDVALLPDQTYQLEDITFLNALFSILKEVTAELTLEFQRSGKVDFIELTNSALRALGQEDDYTDLALIFDSKINHILIDEFQDTSRVHMELLRKLTVGWSYDGRSLFVVGDPMQSIYRFREADVRNFLKVKQRGINALVPEFLQLESNFRSSSQVVEWTNRAFEKVFPDSDDLDRGHVTFMPAKSVNSASAFVPINLHVTPEKEGGLEALSIIKLLKEILSKDSSASIAILVRSRGQLTDILPALREEGLVTSTDGMEQLNEQQEVIDLYALTMSLIHLADSYAWLSVLRAPWCGLSLSDLEIIGRSAKNGLIWEALKSPEVIEQLSSEGRERSDYFMQAFRYAHSMLYREPLAVVVEGLWLRLHGNSCLESSNQQANVDRFFMLLQEFDVSTVMNPEYSLKDALAKYTGSGESHKANVQVMTIHMSKGLEFDHVIMPSMNRITRKGSPALMNWDEIVGLDGQKHLLLSHYQNQKTNQIYQYIQKRNQRQEDAESIRLLYVAFTRAVNSIHVFCAGKARGTQIEISGPKGSFFALLSKVKNIMGELKPFGFLTTEVKQLKPNAFFRQKLKSIPRPSLGNDIKMHYSVKKDAADLIEYEWASESAMHIGTVVHQALSQLGKGTLGQWLAIGEEQKLQHFSRVLKALGIPKKELNHSVQRTLEILMNAVNDEKGNWILDSQHVMIQNEYPISGFVDGVFRNYRIDRTFVDSDGVRWIIDYKTGDHSGANLAGFLDNEVERYKHQLENYAYLISKTEQRPIKLGLYFPLVQGWREWNYLSK